MLLKVQKIESIDSFDEIIKPILTEIVYSKEEDRLALMRFSPKYQAIRQTLPWVNIRKKMFEEGPLIYPRLNTYVDDMTYDRRRDFCIKNSKDFPSAVLEFSKNKIYKDRINAVINYANHFIPEPEKEILLGASLSYLKEKYDHESPEGWYNYEISSPEDKKYIANITTVLAIEILKTELS